MATASTVSAQETLSLLGTNAPAVVDSKDPKSVVLGVKVFSDVAGKILGCSFYKAPANAGGHVVSLWDASGKLLASQTATGETASGKQTVLFATPVQIAAKQTVTCGYFAPQGHYSYDLNAFAAQKDAAPLHAPINGGVAVYSSQATTFPTTAFQASNYWVDVLFALPSSATWISRTNVVPTPDGANITWATAVPSTSQVEYGPTTVYGNTTVLAPAQVGMHSVTLSGLQAGTYHFRVRSNDSDAVMAAGLDYTLVLSLPVSLSVSPASVSVVSGKAQQLTATVNNTQNPSVIWSATAGKVSSSGLFTAPTVTSMTQVNVIATSLADSSKSATALVTVTPLAPALSVSPDSLSFDGQVGSANLSPSSLSITNSGSGTLTFVGVSDQPWLKLSAGSGTAPSTVQVSSQSSGLKAGTYTGHVTVTGGGATRTVGVSLTLTSPPVQHSVALSWKASTSAKVVSYSMYRSSSPGGSYALVGSALGTASYSDQSVQSASTYYYVVTAVDDQGQESAYSNESRAVVP